MTRPGAAEWSVLQLDADPVPGDPESFEEITRAYQDLARTTREAYDLLASGGRIDVGQGKAMEAFRELIGKLPARLDTMAQSYSQAADAYLRYLPSLEEAQSMSLRALEEARQAAAEQGSSQAALATASAAVARLGVDPAADPVARDAATDDLMLARGRQDQAQQALDSAKALLGQATALRDQAAWTAAKIIERLAEDAPQRSLWEKIAEAFQAFVDFLRSVVVGWITAILDVLSAIAFFIFPPLGQAIGLLSGAIDLASALVGGDAGEIALAVGGLALGLIPGGRLVGKILKFAADAGKLAPGTVKEGIGAATKGVGDGRQIGGALPDRGATGPGINRPPNPKDTAIPLDIRDCVSDPVDVATGEMVLAQVDLELPGPLPLPWERTHLSSYRAGRWFGPSWTSTLDQRLEVDRGGVCYLAPDGMILVYPAAPAGTQVLPVHGPRRPLTMYADGTAELTDPALGQTSHFRSIGAEAVLTAIVDADGNRVEVIWDDRHAPVEVRHPAGQRIGLTTDAGRITGLRMLDAEGEPTATVATYSYDGRNRLAEVTNPSGQPMRFSYDAEGRITGWRDRNGYGYRYTYDADGRCVRTEGDQGYLNGTLTHDRERRITVHTDSLGNAASYQLDEAHRTVSHTDPLGNTTSFGWDRYGQLSSRTDPLGRITRYEYDDAGIRTTIIRPDGSTVRASANGNALTIAVDDGERVHTRHYPQRPDLAVEQVGVAAPFDYAALRRDEPVQDTAVAGGLVSRPGRFQPGLARSGGSGPGLARSGGTGPGSRGERAEQVRYDAEGNPVERIDAAGHVRRVEYGPFDLVLATVDATGARTTFEYDTELRLTAVTDPRGLAWRYAYDVAGRLVEEVDFNGRVLRFQHDAAGQLVRSVNGLGEATEYGHDQLGNVIERRTRTGVTSYRHDPVGRLIGASNADAELTIRRDEQGRVTGQTTNGRALTFDYRDDERARHRRTPSGADSVWRFDAFGNPVSLHTAGHTTGIRVDGAGRERQRTVDGRVVLEQTFGDDHRLTEQRLPGLGGRRFDYRGDGLLAGFDDDRDGRTEISLDPAGRIEGVRAVDRDERYRYDGAGNLVAASVPGAPGPVEFRYDGSLVTEAGAIRYRYDAQGRMTSRTVAGPDGVRTWTFSWDSEDRISAVLTPAGDRWRYLYDPLGRRIGKRRHAPGAQDDIVEQVDFVWDGTLMVEQTHTDAWGNRRVTVWEHHPDEQRPVAQSWDDGLDREFCSIVTDLVGTPTELVSAGGETVWRSAAGVWGAPLRAAEDQAAMPLRFPGQYLDAETGLHYNVYRYYDPATGRYVSQDPLGLAPGPDPAAYVPNPYADADPLGLMPAKGKCGAGGKAGVVPPRKGAGNDAAQASASGSTGGKTAGAKVGEHDGVAVSLEHHQNKHHVKDVFGSKLGPFQAQKGSKFPENVNEQWHKEYFAPQVAKLVNNGFDEIKASAGDLRGKADDLYPKVEADLKRADIAEMKAVNAEAAANSSKPVGDPKDLRENAKLLRQDADKINKEVNSNPDVKEFRVTDAEAKKLEDVVNGDKPFSPKKDTQPDGVKYDITATFNPETGKLEASWHGNPDTSSADGSKEKFTGGSWWNEFGSKIQRDHPNLPGRR